MVSISFFQLYIDEIIVSSFTRRSTNHTPFFVQLKKEEDDVFMMELVVKRSPSNSKS